MLEGKRKFIVALVAMGCVTWLGWRDKMESTDLAYAFFTIVGLYMGGNVGKTLMSNFKLEYINKKEQ